MQDNQSQQRSFWTNPTGFSIVDLLAIMYSFSYIGLIVLYARYGNPISMNLLQTMAPAIMIILGGYFTGQAVQQYRMYGNSSNMYGSNPYNSGMYGNNMYGQQQYSQPPAVVSPIAPLNTLETTTPQNQNNV